MKPPKVAVIIPNWNGKELLKDCLKSLKSQTFKNFEIIVVDNGSDDDSDDYLSRYYPGVKVIKLSKNYGFAKAINIGVRNSKTKNVVFLNNDTQADKKWLKNLVTMADKNPKVGSVGCKQLNYYKRDTIDGVGIKINEVGQAKLLGWQEKDLGQYDREMFIFGATAGAALFNRRIFIKAGMFDERYFMYSEEVDWAFRAQFLGYKSIYCPKAIVYHKHKMSSRKKPQHLEYWQFRNTFQTILKDMPFNILIKNWRWLKIILVYFNTIFYQVKSGFIWPPILTHLWLTVNLIPLLYKRFHIQSMKKVKDEYIEGFLENKRITFWGLSK